MATPTLGFQSFYTTTLAAPLSASDTVIYLSTLPTPSEGYLVIEKDSTSAREIVYYTSKGANFVTCPSLAAGRGIGDGNSVLAHSTGASVGMYSVAEMFEALQDGSALAADFVGGWAPFAGTLTYASATTFTAGAGDVAKLAVGSKLRLTQTTAKYFYVVGISGTTVTVTGGTDYTLANAAITSPYFSNAETPVGFPQYFNYTPTWTNLNATTATQASRFCMRGKTIHANIAVTLGASSTVGTDPTFTLPVTSASTGYFAGAVSILGHGIYAGSGSFNTYTYWASTTTAVMGIYATGSTYASVNSITATLPMAYANNYKLTANIQYEAA